METSAREIINAWMRLLRERSDYVAAVFFAAVQILVLLSFLPDRSTWTLLFWYCNNISFFLAIAFYQRNHQLVKGLSYVGLLAQLLWVADFVSHLFDIHLSNTADYVFVEGLTFANEVTVFLHLTVPFIALAYTLRERPQPHSLLYSLVYIIGLYAATLAGTAPQDDVNCVFNACSQYEFSYHILLWPLYLILLSLAAYAIHEYLYRFYAYVSHRLRVRAVGDTLRI